MQLFLSVFFKIVKFYICIEWLSLLSGEGKFMRLHDILSPKEFEFYRSVVERSGDKKP
jgi:hypothetical protein